MTDQVKTKQIRWEDFIESVDLEVGEQVEAKFPPMGSLVIDWIPDLIEDVIVDWHRPRVERWYPFFGLGPLAKQMHQEIRREIDRRELNLPEHIQQELEIAENATSILRDLTARAYGLTPAELTEDEIDHFCAERNRKMQELLALVTFCTPSRLNLTGRE